MKRYFVNLKDEDCLHICQTEVKTMTFKNDFYVTSFCNFPHRLKDGKPIRHECYIIPPKLLRAEMDLRNFDDIRNIWKSWHELGNKRKTMKRGVNE
jgi:hypothetical protein